MSLDLLLEVLKPTLEKNGNIVIEINCENTEDPKKFISNIVKEIHDDSGYNVGYINSDSIYHLIISKGEKK
jgi:hypothetical protein